MPVDQTGSIPAYTMGYTNVPPYGDVTMLHRQTIQLTNSYYEPIQFEEKETTLLNEFSEAFYDADNVIITDIYAAREKDTGEISSKDLVDKIQQSSKNAVYMKDFSEIEEYLKDKLKPGDLFLTIGAGDVYKIGEDIIGKVE